MRDRIDSILKNNRNPFISALSFLDTDDLIVLSETLSGGKWLAEVRRQLNLRVGEYEYICSRVSALNERAIYAPDRR